MSTKIDWADETWNPITGCTPISAGCRNCYAKRMAQRLAGRFGYPADEPFRVTLHPDKLNEPLRWRKPRRVFVCSMSDLFHEGVPNNFRAQIFDVMAAAEHHTFQILTKRPENIRDWEQWMGECWPGDSAWQVTTEVLNRWPDNIWLGVTAENQAAADLRIPQLLQLPAAVRFVSCEPLLGPIDFEQFFALIDQDGEPYGPLCNKDGSSKLSWVIAGGETGPGARPVHPDRFRAIRDQCVAAGVPFFFKQWGEWLPNTLEYGCHQSGVSYNCEHVLIGGTSLPDVTMAKVGKKAAGHLLDSQEWRQFPKWNRATGASLSISGNKAT